jgi:DNA recombination protein RmuC
VQALRAPKTRGRWGEMQLRKVFELAGMSENVDFATEQGMETEAGRLRPDAIVSIPGGKSIVIDAKTPLEAISTRWKATSPKCRPSISSATPRNCGCM